MNSEQQKNSSHIIIMDGKQLRALRQKLKTVNETLNYQKFLYKTERKRIVKQEIQQKIDKYQNLRKEITSTLEDNKPHKYNITVDIYEKFSEDTTQARKRKTDKRRKIKDTYPVHDGETLRLLFKNEQYQITANDLFKKQYEGAKTTMDKETWKYLINVLRQDRAFNARYEFQEDTSFTFFLIHVKHVTKVLAPRKKKLVDIPLHDSGNNNAVFFKYIDYDYNKNAKTFKELFNFSEESYKNSCFIELIMKVYKKEIEKNINESSRQKKDNDKKRLTVENLCELCGIKCKSQNIGLSVKQSVKFFEKYRLGLKAIDIFGNEIEGGNYTPEKVNTHIYPRTLYILVHNNHCYRLNCNDSSFEQVAFDLKSLDKKLDVSAKFPLPKKDSEKYKYVFINELNDVVPHIINNHNDNIKFIFDGSMDELVIEMIHSKYVPELIYKDNSVKGIYFKLRGLSYTIQYSNMASDTVHDIPEEHFDLYNKHNAEINNWLITEKFISRFNDKARDMFKEYFVNPLTATFEHSNQNLVSIDRNKAYTSNLYDMDYIPIFTEFDNFIEYDCHPLEDYTYYLVEFEEENTEVRILTSKRVSVFPGYVLKRCNLKFKTLLFLRPSTLHESNTKGKISELYEANLSDSDKKNIVNVAIGKCSREQNTKCVAKLYLDQREASHYAKKYNGVVRTLASTQWTEVNELDDDDMFVRNLFNKNVEKSTKIKAYLVVCERKKKLEETLLPIKLFIYTMQRLKNLQVYRKLVDNSLTCYGIKTDSLFTEATEEQLNEIFTFNTEVGGLKIERNKELVYKDYEFSRNSYFIEKKSEVNTMFIKSEDNYFSDPESYNNEIKDILSKHNNVIFLATYPGAGKSFASQMCSKKALYVTPYNQLCQELIIKGHKAITLHNLMALSITGDSCKRKKYDVSEFDTIVFEEILLYDPKLLSSIHRFIKQHADKKIIANGDISQNLPILFNLNNVSSQENYLIESINSMFPNQVILTMNKRLKEENDRQKLKSLKDDILDLDLDVMKTFHKHGFKIIDKMEDLQSTKNVSYFRSRSYKINKNVQDKLGILGDYIIFDHVCNGKTYTYKYYVGQKIVCRNTFKRRLAQLYTNYVYEILDINKKKKEITVKSIYKEDKMFITFKQLKYCTLPYSSTCHSVQGTTINEPYTIFDTNIAYADRRWIWTAVTRSTKLEDITIFKHSDTECEALERAKYKQYFDLKIHNYVDQDINAGRIKKTKEGILYKNQIIDDYINYKWFMEQDDLTCYMCGETFDFELKDSHVVSNMTCDRLDNKIYHSKTNCKLCCLSCNVAKK